MKNLLGTMKGKIIAGAVSLAVVAVIIIAIILSNQGYRSIVVKEMNGSVTVANQSKTTNAFLGQKLVDGDEVTVAVAADLMLLLDSDKYIYAEENSHFWIDAKGKKGNTRTTIRQDAGTNLYEIDNKLTSSENFNVNTSNATLSVRGTVFRVGCKTEGADKYTTVEVFEGEVYVEAVMEDGTSTGDSRVLKAGEMVIIHSNSTVSEFLEGESKEVVSEIEYSKIPQATARFLGKIIDKGRPLCIGKELLFDLVEINDHRYVATDEVVEATCTEEGYTIYVCEICSAEIKDDIVEAKKHKYGDWEIIKEPTVDQKGKRKAVCEVCGDEITEDIDALQKEDENSSDESAKKDESKTTTENKTEKPKENENKQKTPSVIETPKVPETPKTPETPVTPPSNEDPCANGHSYKEEIVAATCDATGSVTKTCSVCGAKEVVKTLPALGHDYTVTVKVDREPTCSSTGLKTIKCSRCTSTTSQSIAKDPTKHKLGTATSDGLTNHSSICDLCGTKVTEKHASSKKAQIDPTGTGHAYICDKCNEEFDFDQHTPIWVTDASQHTQKCKVCEMIYKSGPHRADGGTLVTPVDENYHSFTCECGYVVKERHTNNGTPTPSVGTCRTCLRADSNLPGTP